MNDIDYNLKNLTNTFPVPADCPAYTLVVTPKRSIWWNVDYIPYRGKPEWCAKCCLYGTYCDGYTVRPRLEEESTDEA